MDLSDDVVSIVAPAYNHEKYIIDALSSIARQTYYNKELIIIDDCSKDSTAAWIERYLGRGIVHELFPAGIHFIRHPENRNAHRTLNEGIEMASGKYVSIINTDDCYEENRLEVMVEALQRSRARLAFSRVRCIDGEGKYTEEPAFEERRSLLNRYPSPSFALAVTNVAIGTGNFIFEKTLCQEIGGFCQDYHFIHDWDFVLKSTAVCGPVYAEDTCYLYRFHATNTIKQIGESQENERRKDREVRAVLLNFLNTIRNGKAQNPLLRDIHTWDYFFRLIPGEYCSFLWRQLEEKEQHGI